MLYIQSIQHAIMTYLQTVLVLSIAIIVVKQVCTAVIIKRNSILMNAHKFVVNMILNYTCIKNFISPHNNIYKSQDLA